MGLLTDVNGKVKAGALDDGAITTLGVTTDDAASSTAAETTTARTVAALLKGIKNILVLLNAKQVSGTDIGDVTVNNAAGDGVYVRPGTSAEFAVSVAASKIADGADATQGITTGAAVITDAAGTVQQYLRGLVKLIASKINIGTIDTVSAVTALPLPSGAATAALQAAPATIVYGKTTVTTAGTEVALGTTAALTRGVWVKALGTNTGAIYVGLDPVTSLTGYELYAGQSVFLEVADRATVFIDSAVNGEGVTYVGS